MKYKKPTMHISKFDIENIVTTSGEMPTEPQIIEGAASEYAAGLKANGTVQETIVLTF